MGHTIRYGSSPRPLAAAGRLDGRAEGQVHYVNLDGADLGSYLVNDWYAYADRAGAFAINSEVLLDGRQRLTALEGYLLGEFGVPDESGQVRYWSELGNDERRHFLNMLFAQARVHERGGSRCSLMFEPISGTSNVIPLHYRMAKR